MSTLEKHNYVSRPQVMMGSWPEEDLLGIRVGSKQTRKNNIEINDDDDHRWFTEIII